MEATDIMMLQLLQKCLHKTEQAQISNINMCAVICWHDIALWDMEALVICPGYPDTPYRPFPKSLDFIYRRNVWKRETLSKKHKKVTKLKSFTFKADQCSVYCMFSSLATALGVSICVRGNTRCKSPPRGELQSVVFCNETLAKVKNK